MKVILNKIEVKKTKIQVLTEIENDSLFTRQETFNALLLNSLIAGASGNALRQVTRAGVTEEEFRAIEEAQREYSNLVYKLEQKLSVSLDNVVVYIHKFH